MKLSGAGRLFVAVVCAAGWLVLGACIWEVTTKPIRPEWLVLAGLTLLSGSFTIKIPSLGARFSVSETFVFTSVLLFGTAAGTITLAIDALIAAWGSTNRKQPVRILFNLSAATLSIWLASQVFYAASGIGPLIDNESTKLPDFVLPLALQTLVYFLTNSCLVAVAIGFERNTNWFLLWRRNFLWLGVNYFGGASVAALLVSYTRTVDLTAFGIIVPLLVISYLTFKTALGRIEDANRHVEQVSKLYLSTIETLAMAIDAKDQVTHGHIRRVQAFTLGLAKALGVQDEVQLKALEAAALLHDTGKLVVPEHILNKPGRLTPGEFDKMKRHASAGAEILSAIQFPYPVVPIVRHHHENWDGTGYPDGLKGTAIPLGARILQVVDCFDALTSDRPYRRKLSDEDALGILMQRRGIMYDPLVVDMFAAVKDALDVSQLDDGSKLETLSRDQTATDKVSHLFEEVQNLQATNPALFREAQVVLRSIIESTSANLATLYVRNPRTDELFALVAVSPDGNIAPKTTMPVGTRVSGWVAANGRAILNADAALDLLAETGTANVTRCMCVPLAAGGAVIAVVAVYMNDSRGFTEHDLMLTEAAASSIDARQLQVFIESVSLQRTRPHPAVH